VKLQAHVESRVRRYVSSNVVGRVPGVSAANQAVLYTAHYDHLGIDPDAKGDNIYNGAADNGTGCGILLEMARAFAQSPTRRRTRSILPRLPPRNRACWARSFWACIRRCRRGRFRSI
jgi:Zn-dependent M28 family amino/carboxypeptidase